LREWIEGDSFEHSGAILRTQEIQRIGAFKMKVKYSKSSTIKDYFIEDLMPNLILLNT